MSPDLFEALGSAEYRRMSPHETEFHCVSQMGSRRIGCTKPGGLEPARGGHGLTTPTAVHNGYLYRRSCGLFIAHQVGPCNLA